jgi:60kDa lysophospholipase
MSPQIYLLTLNSGSQAPMHELQNDATDNLLGSLVIAGHFMIPEVCLFFNYKLFRGNRTTKVSSTEFGAFAAPNQTPLATMTSVRTDVDWASIHRPRTIDQFSIQLNLDMAHVACLRIFPGIKPEMVDGVLRVEGLRGLVLETFGAGNAPSGKDGALTKILAAAIKRGIVIVNVTQCLTGSVSGAYAASAALRSAGVVFGLDLTTEAALTKLSYLLALPGLTQEEVSRQMSISLRGEITESSNTTFSHPGGLLSSKLASLAALGYKITEGDGEGVNEMINGSEGAWLLNESDYSGNTPLVSPLFSEAASPATPASPSK